LAQDGREAKIAFMKRFHVVGPKYARNIWIDAYHPDFRNTIAVDLRIRKITEALGHSFKTYEEEERLYQDIAKAADLQGWEVDRLLYKYTDRFLADKHGTTKFSTFPRKNESPSSLVKAMVIFVVS
jgi:hypothetical protein